jgi:excisionase family DNA binding protein
VDDIRVLLSIFEVAAMLGVSPRHVRRLYESNAFPKPVRLGATLRWHRSIVDDFLRSLHDREPSPKAARRKEASHATP